MAAALDFPTAPTSGQLFTGAGCLWQWDGTTWRGVSAAAAAIPLARFVAVGGELSFTFAVPQNYADFAITFVGRDTGNVAFANAYIKFNGDATAANYSNAQINQVSGGTNNSTSTTPTTNGTFVVNLAGVSGNANAIAGVTIEVENYAGAVFHKAVTARFNELDSAGPTQRVGLAGSVWKSTAPITSVTVTTTGSGLAAGSTAVLYGKGAGQLISVGGGSSLVPTDLVAPASPADGTLWWKSDEGTLKIYYDDGSSQQWVDASSAVPGSGVVHTVNGRLTLTSGVPITTSDVIGATSIYFTPFMGNLITLWSGTAWVNYSFAELQLALSGLTSGKNYDLFAYPNSGVVTLDAPLVWTSDTVRATAVTLQDGRYCKSGDKTRLYLGTFRATGANTTEDSGGGTTSQVGGKRFLWNYYNRTPRYMQVFDSATIYNYTTATWRQQNNNTGNRVEYVVGISEELIKFRVEDTISVSATANAAKISIGVDSTVTPSRGIGSWFNSNSTSEGNIIHAAYEGYPGIGYHALNVIQNGGGASLANWGVDVAGSLAVNFGEVRG